MSKQIEKVEGLNIELHDIDVAVIVHYAGGLSQIAGSGHLAIAGYP